LTRGAKPTAAARWTLGILGALLAGFGGALAVGGFALVRLHGSPYYLIAGLALLVAGVLTALRRVEGAILYGATFAGTVGWAIWEVGLQYWPLAPRLAAFLVMAVVMLLILPLMTGGRWRRIAHGGAAVIAVSLFATGVAAFAPHGVAPAPARDQAELVEGGSGAPEWRYVGGSPAGTRYSPHDQLTSANVAGLQRAWMVRTGDAAGGLAEDQNTPIQVGATIYACTPHSHVLALDADTGEVRWRFAPPEPPSAYSRCRSLAYYDAAARAPAPDCARRIFMTSSASKLFALDARSGRLCRSFGDAGEVDLRRQVGVPEAQKFYLTLSGPTVVRDRIIVGATLGEGRAERMPSGVIRAFDAMTGKPVWAFDPGRPDDTRPLPADRDYTPSVPNMWSIPAFDEQLGMIYLPLGNAADDFWGRRRSRHDEAYGSAVLALDAETGHERWRFQTVHHDLWDYDLGPQPALYDLPDGRGGRIPVLVQATKTGQIFVLDRRDGRPVKPVVERPVPTGGFAGDHTAPTQPYSLRMPQIGHSRLTEASMWGITPLDQLLCRIAFRRTNYQGPYTPIDGRPTLVYPGYYGGLNWGGVSIDEARGLLVVNDIRLPNVIRMVPQAEVARRSRETSPGLRGIGVFPQVGGPFATLHYELMSPLGIPCNAPPWGTLSGVDLRSGALLWQRPMGTLEDTILPGGLRIPLPLPVGMPTLGGPSTTRSGLTFFAGTKDFYLRALDTRSGRELWKARLPVGTQSTPITYVSPRSGRQFVLVSAGGARLSPRHGDYIIAYALPPGGDAIRRSAPARGTAR
jgi:quinate dehydrogenase (quinone)